MVNQNAFLLLYLLPVEGCRQRLGFRRGRILSFPGAPGRSLGGIHILLHDGRTASLRLLPGYGEWEGARGFWTASTEPSLPLRYKMTEGEGHREYIFELSSREGVFLRLSPGLRFPVKKSIPFLDSRGGIVHARCDLGQGFSMTSVEVRWPGSIAGLFSGSPRLLALAYASSTVSAKEIVAGKVFDYIPGAVLGQDMREIRSRRVGQALEADPPAHSTSSGPIHTHSR